MEVLQLKHLLKYYKPHRAALACIILLLFAQVTAELALPRLMAKIIDDGIVPGDMPVIYATGLIMLAVSFIGVLCAAAVSYFSSWIASAASKEIRRALFENVTSFTNIEFDLFSTASLITRSTNDVQVLQNTSVMIFRMAFYAPIMGIGALIGAYTTSPSLSWTIVIGIIGILMMVSFMLLVTLPKFKIVQRMVDRLNLIMGERLNGVLVIRSFNREKDEENRFDQANEDLTKLNTFVNRAFSFMMPGLMLIMNLSAVLIVWAGSNLMNAGNLQIGSMLAFIQYSMSVIMSFLFISMMFIMIPRALVSGQRIGEVVHTKPAIVDPTGLSPAAPITKGLIEFKHVSFSYPGSDENVLSDISFVARPGETTALIGSTGSGKSTIVNLIPRFYDVTEGEICIDGVDIRTLPQQVLRSQIGYVPQKAVLFSGTIDSNLRVGKPEASEEDLSSAAETAQALAFIHEKPEGFETPIAQGGTNVSGGQRQRLSIARALAINPKILIFDDSFSALDFKTDAALRNALKGNQQDATLLIVAQRINTILHAEQILVIEDGMIVGKGTHQALMAGCTVYREIARSQLSEKELEREEASLNE